MKRVLKWVFGIFLGLIIIGLLFGEKTDSDTTAKGQSESVVETEPIAFETTAAEISKAYADNTLAADKKYKGKTFIVTGTVAEINTDMFDRAYLILKGGVNQFMEPQFVLDDAEKDKAASLAKGQAVKLKCLGKGDIAKTPMSEDCQII
jgi:ribosomal protein S1